MTLTHGLEHIHDLAIHQAEIARIERDFDIRDAVNQAIKDRRSELLEPGFALSFSAHSVDDLVTFFPLFRQFQDDFRRILQVSINDDDGIATRIVPAGRDGNLMPKIARKDDRADMPVGFSQFADFFCGAVCGTIVHEYKFPGLA